MIVWSEQNDKIAPAFVKAQSACDSAKKDSENAAFKQGGKASKYADLSSVWAACEDALTANKLGVIQLPGLIRDGKMSMATMLVHESGQWLQGEGEIPLPKSDPQGQGSATTYFRRYALAGLMGVVQEDDDGNAAAQPRSAPQAVQIEDRITEAQFKELSALAEKVGTDNRQFCTFYKIKSASELPASKFDHAMAALRKKLPAPEKEAA